MINIIVQARMGSERLPGKVMREINGKPLIGYLLDRLAMCQQADRLVCAIPEEDSNGPLGSFIRSRDIDVVTGPNEDVARRFAKALEVFPCDYFVRVCGDSPLMDPKLIDGLIIRLRRAVKTRHVKYMRPEKIFSGMLPEIVSAKAFLKALPHMTSHEREHVTLCFSREQNLVVDDEKDLGKIERVLNKMTAPHTDYGQEECLMLLRR